MALRQVKKEQGCCIAKYTLECIGRSLRLQEDHLMYHKDMCYTRKIR